jgi:methionyl aminopeptidase
MAMTSYPDPSPVPNSIPRPAYVPVNFFDAPWGEHSQVPIDTIGPHRKSQLGQEGIQGVRKAGRAVGDILKEVEKLVKVSDG